MVVCVVVQPSQRRANRAWLVETLGSGSPVWRQGHIDCMSECLPHCRLHGPGRSSLGWNESFIEASTESEAGKQCLTGGDAKQS